MYLKAAAFVVICSLSSGLLLAKEPTVEVAVLLGLVIWSSCRAYYFAFYVIERYIDPAYKFSGLGSFAAYVVSRKSGPGGPTQPREGAP